MKSCILIRLYNSRTIV